MVVADFTDLDPPNSVAWRVATQRRIDAQAALVATIRPGTSDHRISTSVLLMLRDSLFVLSQSQTMLEAARQQTKASEINGWKGFSRLD